MKNGYGRSRFASRKNLQHLCRTPSWTRLTRDSAGRWNAGGRTVSSLLWDGEIHAIYCRFQGNDSEARNATGKLQCTEKGGSHGLGRAARLAQMTPAVSVNPLFNRLNCDVPRIFARSRRVNPIVCSSTAVGPLARFRQFGMAVKGSVPFPALHAMPSRSGPLAFARDCIHQ